MVVSDYFKPIDAIVIEEKPTSELPTPEDLRARMSSPKLSHIHRRCGFDTHALQRLCVADRL